LLDHWFWGWLLPKLNVIPVDQEGSDRSALKALIRILRAGQATLVFPEGARTLDGNLQPAQPGLGLVIAKTLAPVVPMRIFGAHEAWPRGVKKSAFIPLPSWLAIRFFSVKRTSLNEEKTYINV
jgi:1-acyl-sn-glycerol-3-phosphate acyltransferase